MRSKQEKNLIGRVLSPALQLWLRTQLQGVEDLQIDIGGSNRQILRGYIPSVFLKSRRAVYQGLHLGNAQIMGENIRINIGQIVKGKPLELLEPVKVTGELWCSEEQLNASLSSSILADALRELLYLLLELNGIEHPQQRLQNYQVSWQEIGLHEGSFSLKGSLIDAAGKVISLVIAAQLELVDPQSLQFFLLETEGLSDIFSLDINKFTVDLGSDVELASLILDSGKLMCCGAALVRS